MRFNVVLFDLDGTLLNTNDLIIASFQHTLREKLGLEVSAQELYPYFGEPLPDTMARYAPDRAEELTDFYRVYNMVVHDELIRQFDGVNDAVATLHAAGVKLAVVTSKKTDTARRGLKVGLLEQYFPVLVGMDATEKHKPNPEPALLALQRLGVEPSPQVLMVGDSKFDILCGRNAGAKTAAVGWTVQDRAELSLVQPDYWLDQASDLVSLVLHK